MTGGSCRPESQRGNSLYLQNDIDQAAVRLAVLATVLTPAPTGRCGVTTSPCTEEPCEGESMP
jgi:hypothetical protein